MRSTEDEIRRKVVELMRSAVPAKPEKSGPDREVTIIGDGNVVGDNNVITGRPPPQDRKPGR